MSTACPKCEKPGGALTADPHCTHEDCSWNKCKCGAVYSRVNAQGFSGAGKTGVFYPAPT